jgi:hypothetical protein
MTKIKLLNCEVLVPCGIADCCVYHTTSQNLGYYHEIGYDHFRPISFNLI